MARCWGAAHWALPIVSDQNSGGFYQPDQTARRKHRERWDHLVTLTKNWRREGGGRGRGSSYFRTRKENELMCISVRTQLESGLNSVPTALEEECSRLTCLKRPALAKPLGKLHPGVWLHFLPFSQPYPSVNLLCLSGLPHGSKMAANDPGLSSHCTLPVAQNFQ